MAADSVASNPPIEFSASLEDIFGDFFGFGRGGGGGGRQQRRRGRTSKSPLISIFFRPFMGVKSPSSIPRKEHCSTCDGTGAAPGSKPVTCDMCNGTGKCVDAADVFQIRQPCPKCKGKGKIIVKPCKDCKGEGRVRRKNDVKISVPPGVDTGVALRLSGKGNDGEAGASPGDLKVVLRVRDHDFFQREGEHITCTIPITYPQACLGAKVQVPTVDDDTELKILLVLSRVRSSPFVAKAPHIWALAEVEAISMCRLLLGFPLKCLLLKKHWCVKLLRTSQG